MNLNKVLKIFIILSFFVSTCFPIFAYTIYLRDGRTISDISEVKDTGNYFLVYKSNTPETYSKQKIQKILSNTGNVIFEHKNLTAEKRINSDGKTQYEFYLNGRKTGSGEWLSNGIFKVDGELTDGTYKQYFNSGKLETEIPIKKNNINGTFKIYYPSGKVSREGSFVNSIETGESLLYYKSGEIKGKSSYRNGKKNGITYLYYPSGEIKAEMNFEDGKINGLQKMYYENGNISTLVNFNNGRKHGYFKNFYENGKIKISGNTKNGKLDGTINIYYKSGRLKQTKHFIDGRLQKKS